MKAEVGPTGVADGLGEPGFMLAETTGRLLGDDLGVTGLRVWLGVSAQALPPVATTAAAVWCDREGRPRGSLRATTPLLRLPPPLAAARIRFST